MASEQQFLEHIRDHQGIIIKLVNLYAHDEEGRKDLYQEILYQAWKGYTQFRGESKFSTWLYRLSLNTILTSKRKAGRMVYTETLAEESLIHHPDQLHAERRQQLQQAIWQLPETDRAIITLHLDGYANPEIASIMGISANHTGVKLHRIKTALAHLLQQQGEAS